MLQRVESAARAVYLALGCRGLGRADFIVVDGEPVFLELNTLPGVTAESLLPRAVRAAGYELAAVMGRLVDLAVGRHAAMAARRS